MKIKRERRKKKRKDEVIERLNQENRKRHKKAS